jgi:hypothetical protein
MTALLGFNDRIAQDLDYTHDTISQCDSRDRFASRRRHHKRGVPQGPTFLTTGENGMAEMLVCFRTAFDIPKYADGISRASGQPTPMPGGRLSREKAWVRIKKHASASSNVCAPSRLPRECPVGNKPGRTYQRRRGCQVRQRECEIRTHGNRNRAVI